MDCGCKAVPPPIRSRQWHTYRVPMEDGYRFEAARQETVSGLVVTCAYETYCKEHPWNDDPEFTGSFVRIVISRPNRYPTWEEMRDYIEASPYIDHKRNTFMILPARENYVNVASYAMHWVQRRV